MDLPLEQSSPPTPKTPEWEAILHTAQTAYGRSMGALEFRAFDSNQRPTGEPLTAEQFTSWLIETNAHRSHEELKDLAARYDTALEQQRVMPGISEIQLASLAIASAVFQALADEKQPPTRPKLEKVVKKGTAKEPPPPWQRETGEGLAAERAQLLQELGLRESAMIDARTIDAALQSLVAEKTQALDDLMARGAIDLNERTSQLEEYKGELERKSLELQSIEARLRGHRAPPPRQATPQERISPPPKEIGQHRDKLEGLLAQEQRIRDEMGAIARTLEKIGLPPRELRSVRAEIEAIQTLLADLEATTEESADEQESKMAA